MTVVLCREELVFWRERSIDGTYIEIPPVRRLEPHELLRAFVRYKHVDYYDQTLFNRTYDWMKAHGLTEGQSQHAALVVG